MPHQAVGLQAGDQPATAAINATVRIAIDGMIEHIEEFRLELRVNPLRDREVLEDRHVRQEFPRAGEAVALNVPEAAKAGVAKRAALCQHRSAAHRIVAHSGHGLEEHDLVGLVVEGAGPHSETTLKIGAAWSGIPI